MIHRSPRHVIEGHRRLNLFGRNPESLNDQPSPGESEVPGPDRVWFPADFEVSFSATLQGESDILNRARETKQVAHFPSRPHSYTNFVDSQMAESPGSHWRFPLHRRLVSVEYSTVRSFLRSTALASELLSQCTWFLPFSRVEPHSFGGSWE